MISMQLVSNVFCFCRLFHAGSMRCYTSLTGTCNRSTSSRTWPGSGERVCAARPVLIVLIASRLMPSFEKPVFEQSLMYTFRIPWTSCSPSASSHLVASALRELPVKGSPDRVAQVTIHYLLLFTEWITPRCHSFILSCHSCFSRLSSGSVGASDSKQMWTW